MFIMSEGDEICASSIVIPALVVMGIKFLTSKFGQMTHGWARDKRPESRVFNNLSGSAIPPLYGDKAPKMIV